MIKHYFVTYHWEGGDVPATVKFLTVEAGCRWLENVRRTPPGNTPAVIDDMSPELRPPVEIPVPEREHPARAESEEGKNAPARRTTDWYWGGNVNRPRRLRKGRDGQLEETGAGTVDDAHGDRELARSRAAEPEEDWTSLKKSPEFTPGDDDRAEESKNVSTKVGDFDFGPSGVGDGPSSLR